MICGMQYFVCCDWIESIFVFIMLWDQPHVVIHESTLLYVNCTKSQVEFRVAPVRHTIVILLFQNIVHFCSVIGFLHSSYLQ